MKRYRYFKKAHSTWHFTVLCAGVVIGLACGAQGWASVFGDVSWLVLGVVLFALVIWKQWRWMLGVALVAGALIGMSRGAMDVGNVATIARFHNHEVTVKGTVSEDADVGKRGNTTVRLKDVSVDGARQSGTLWVALADKTDAVWRSDIITVQGKLQEGFGNFAGTIYRAELTHIARPTPGDVALRVRDDVGKHVREHVHEPAASLGMGYIAGQRRALPNDLAESLKIAGLTHVVVASGYNLTILVRFARRFLAKYSRFLTVFVSGGLVMAFIGVTGMSPSMMRAGLVAGLALLAWYLGRKFHPATLLAFAAAATGLLEPSYVWGSLGWQLSFLSFAGVMIIAPLLQHYFFGKKKAGVIRQIIGETCSAQLATAPLILFAFGTFSTVALAANILVLPLIPLAMVLTFLTGIGAYVWHGIGWLVGQPTMWLLDYMIWVAEQMSAFSWSSVEWTISPWMCVAMYGVLVAVVLYLLRATKLRLRDTSIIE